MYRYTLLAIVATAWAIGGPACSFSPVKLGPPAQRAGDGTSAGDAAKPPTCRGDCRFVTCGADAPCCTGVLTEAELPADGVDNNCDGLVDAPVLLSRVPAGDEAASAVEVNFVFDPPVSTDWFLECRTARSSTIESAGWKACGGGGLSISPFDALQSAEADYNGTWTTQMRIRLPADLVSETFSHTYYIHNSLHGAPRCPVPSTDTAYVAKAAERLSSPDAGFFSIGDSTYLRSPFIRVEYDLPFSASLELYLDGESITVEMLSLRRRFVLSPDNRYLLITRVYESRRMRAANDTQACAAATFDVHLTRPVLGVEDKNRYTSQSCEAIVLNHAGAGVCLHTDAGGSVQFAKSSNSVPAGLLGWTGANKFMYRQLAESEQTHAAPRLFSPKCYESPTCALGSTLVPIPMTYLPDHDLFFP